MRYSLIVEALQNYCTPDDDGVRSIIRQSTLACPDVTYEEIAEAVHLRGPGSRKKDSPFAYLIAYVPKVDFQEMRRRAESEKRRREEIEARSRREYQETLAMARKALSDPNTSDEDRRFFTQVIEADVRGGQP